MLGRLHLMPKLSRIRTYINYLLRSLSKKIFHKKKQFTLSKKTLVVVSLGIFLGLFLAWFFLLRGDGAAAWYHDGWGYRKKLTIDHTKVSGDTNLTDFPLLISLTSDTHLSSNAQADGDDIMFTDSIGNKLDHEIESYSSGTLIAWVRIPTLYGTQNTDLYMYYGNSSAASQENATNVWDENYQAVWHLEESSNGSVAVTRGDSTSNGNTLSDQDTLASATGKIGSSTVFDNATTDDLRILTGNQSVNFPGKSGADLSDGYTFSTWAKFTHHTGGHTHNLAVHGMDVFHGFVTNNAYQGDFAGSIPTSASSVTSTTEWYYLTTTWNGSQFQTYINGDASGTPVSSSSFPTSTNTFYLGTRGSSSTTRSLGGYLDEVRLQNKYRTSDWIATEYANQNSPSTFYSTGYQESRTRGPAAYWKFDEGYGTDVNDSSGNENTGTLGAGSAAPTWGEESMCISGTCLQFDGTNDYATIPDTSSLDLSNTGTIEMWVKTNNDPSNLSSFSAWTSLTPPDGAYPNNPGEVDAVIVGDKIYYVSFLHVTSTEYISTANSDLDGSNFSGWTVQTAPNGVGNNETSSIAIDSDGTKLYYIAFVHSAQTEVIYYANSNLDGTSMTAWTSFTPPDGAGATQDQSTIDMTIVGNKMYIAAYLHDDAVETFSTSSMNLDGSSFSGWTSQSAPDGAAAYSSSNVAIQSDGSILYYAVFVSNGTTEVFETATSALDGTSFSAWTSRAAPDGSALSNFSGIDMILAAGKLYFAAYLHSGTTEYFYTADMNLDGSNFSGWTSRTAPDGSSTGGTTMPALATNNSALYYVAFASNSTTESLYLANVTGLTYYPILSKSGAYTLVQSGSGFALEWAGPTINFGNITSNKWYHVTISHDGSSMRAFVNGNLMSTQSTTADFSTNANNLLIGSNGSSYFKGIIDELRIYPYARTSDQIKLDFQGGGSRGSSVVLGAQDLSFLSNGLVGYWNMDEVSGSSLSDYSGNANTATAEGTTVVSGKFGNSRSFTTSDMITIPSTQNLQLSNNFSFGGWVNIANTGAQRDFIHKSTEYMMRLDDIGEGNKISCFIYLSNNWESRVSSTSTPIAGTWNHYFCTYDGTQLKLYVNGVLDNTVNREGNIITTNNDVLLGVFSNFTGALDEYRHYNRALSSDEVKKLYKWAPGPVAYYDLDEGTGTTTVSDKSGNRNDLTMSDLTETSWTQGKYGGALNFRGNNADDELYGNSMLNNLPNGDFTTSFWFNWNVDGSMNWDVPIGKREVTPGGWWIQYEATNRTIALQADFGTTDVNYLSASNVYSFNQWTYATVVFRSATNTAEFYINGVKTGYGGSTQAGVGTYQDDSSNTFRIGRDNEAGQRWNGMLDDIRIYNYARTQEQIMEDMNAGHPAVGTPVGSTVLHLKMDEGYGTNVNDSSPQGNNGTISGAAWTNEGKFGKAMSFNGTSGYINASSDDSLDDLSTVTVSAWIYPTGYGEGNFGRIVNKSDTNNTNWALTLVNNSSQQSIRFFKERNSASNATQVTAANGSIQLNQWYHVVGVYDENTTPRMKLFINGTEATYAEQIEGTGSPDSDASYNLSIGNRLAGDRTFQGIIDEVKIYPFVLTAEQIKLDNQGGKSLVLGAQSTGVGGTSPSNSSARSYCIPGDTSMCNAPVFELNFEEATGQTAYDTSTNGNNGTINGATWGLGPDHMAGSALEFDGSNDFVEIDGDEHVITGSQFTVSAWFKSNDAGTARRTIYNEGSEVVFTYTNMFISLNDGEAGRIRAFLRDEDTSSADITYNGGYNDNNWHFVSFVKKSASSHELYVDGLLVGTSSTTIDGPYDSITAQTVGRREQETALGDYFSGSIDQVRVFNYARTPSQIAWEYSKGAPIAHYRLDECQNTTAYNSAFSPSGAAGNNGTINAGSSGNTSVGTCTSGSSTQMWANGASGKWGASLDFDEVDDRLVIPDIALGQEFTVSFWFNSDDNTGTGYQYMYSHGTIQTANSVNIYFNEDSNAINTPGTILVSVMDSDDGIPLLSQDVQTQVGLSDSSWHHLVMTISSSGTKAYIDGVQQISYTNGNGGVNPSGDIYIGARNDLNSLRFYDGKLDDIRIYNYALTTTQIKELYKGGAVVFN